MEFDHYLLRYPMRLMVKKVQGDGPIRSLRLILPGTSWPWRRRKGTNEKEKRGEDNN